MATIFDYITWRGDLDFKESSFNEIDNLILARLSYFPFDTLFENNETISISDAYQKFSSFPVSNFHILQKEDLDLFPALAQSRRFGPLLVCDYCNKVDPKEEKQFSAITILLSNGDQYVSFRGTDNTLVGWKEDLNMSFQDRVPSQLSAVAYLNEIGKKHSGNFLVGGHSKGGNLAIYASCFCDRSIQNRILHVYNNDGPGFVEKVIQSSAYQSILDRVTSFVPQSSVIGRLLNHEESYYVVQSTQSGIMQHDLYSWQLLGKSFICLDQVTNGSVFIDKTIKDWLASVSPSYRAEFVDILFSILETTNAKTMSQISAKWFSNAIIILKSYKNVDKEKKEIISHVLFSLFSMAKENAKLELLPKKTKKHVSLSKK